MQTTRSKVIEKGVELEDLVSRLLSLHILDMTDEQKETSYSFGSKSFSLSLSSKIYLLIDLKFIPEEVKKDFILFLEIRNKFAHVLKVDSFKECLQYINDKNRFLKKHEKDKDDLFDEEFHYGLCFDFLCAELGLFLRVCSEFIHKNKTQDLKKTAVIEMLRTSVEKNKIDNNLVKDILKLVSEISIDENYELLKKKYNNNN